MTSPTQELNILPEFSPQRAVTAKYDGTITLNMSVEQLGIILFALSFTSNESLLLETRNEAAEIRREVHESLETLNTTQ